MSTVPETVELDMGFDSLCLDRIIDLEADNQRLRDDLARKYHHVKKLKRKLQEALHLLEDSNIFVSQSGEEDARLTISQGASMTTNQVTAFADEDAGWSVEIDAGKDSTMDLATSSDSDLGNFLQRPIKVVDQEWLVGQSFKYSFNPWSTFLGNSFVSQKVANFELIRMKMNVKVVISGTGFHYGRLMASYNPLSGYDQVTVNRQFFDVDLIGASQRPHFFCNPTTNEGGEMKIPYFFRENYISLSKGDAQSMGEFSIDSFDELRHSNGSTDPITVTVYLWAEDITLTMPTSTTTPALLTSQAGIQNTINSGDEYGQGIISKPASAIAHVAGLLKQVPVIGPYMRATEMLSSSLGAAARLFGFSRPTIVTDVVLQKPSPTGNLVNTDAADAVLKLTMDSKAEVTIDPRVTGLGAQDEMNIVDLACKETYLTSFTWDQLQDPDDLLWQSRVTPTLHGILGSEIHPTAAALVSTPFQHWQGSMKFRFQILKSGFHKGRILARYDPRQHSDTIDYNTNYSRVIDIADEEDFEIVVGWGQNNPFLAVPSMDPNNEWYKSNLPRLGSDSIAAFNGVLEIDVLNKLVSPIDTGLVTINVFVSMCDDFKLAVPNDIRLNGYHLFPPPTPEGKSELRGEPREIQQSKMVLDSQSGESPMADMDNRPTGTTSVQEIGSCGEVADQTMNVFFGESITSIRELCKRYSVTRTWAVPPAENISISYATLSNKDIPYYSGYDPQGVDLDFNEIFPLTISQAHYINWFAPAYAGYRGAIRRKHMFSGSTTGSNPIVARQAFTTTVGQWAVEVLGTTANNPYNTKWLSTRVGFGSRAGAASTNIGVNNTIETELPFYNEGRIGYTRLIQAPDLNCNSHKVSVGAFPPDQYKSSPGPTAIQEWVAAGEDFSLYFFTGAPILYRYVINENT